MKESASEYRVGYRGRLAPSPTGFLHLGHARTFWTAQERARQARGALVLRNEDLDQTRCKPEFVTAMIEDLRWFGLQWQEGPDCGGPHAPYSQAQRLHLYARAFEELRNSGWIYPCTCSRQDVSRATTAPHAGEDEPLYPGTCRGKALRMQLEAPRVNWRFRVPNGEAITFWDSASGQHCYTAGQDFGDFVIWRHDGVPSYQLAVVVDDAEMKVTEVVRGEDLLRSTARQLLLYGALGLKVPDFFHCPLVKDEAGVRLAKRHEGLSLRNLRASGASPAELRAKWIGT